MTSIVATNINHLLTNLEATLFHGSMMKHSPQPLPILFFLALCVVSLQAFVVVPRQPHLGRTIALSMVGGKGWDNDDFLSGLSGNDEDRQQAADSYREFSEGRKAFMDRQKEIMKTPQAREFLEKQQRQQMARSDRDSSSPVPNEYSPNKVQPGSGGGSRMAQMMAQAQKMKYMQQQLKEMGFEQKLAVPLDDDDEDDEE